MDERFSPGERPQKATNGETIIAALGQGLASSLKKSTLAVHHHHSLTIFASFISPVSDSALLAVESWTMLPRYSAILALLRISNYK